jgi:PIN domain nuclease of toxin-antitoxin system
MKILVDTHTLLWALRSPERLSATSRDLLSDRATTILVSHVTLWEMVLKLRELGLPLALGPYLDQSMTRLGATWLPLAMNHMLAVLNLPPIHRDPFDRLLVAQAAHEQIPLISADATLARYPVRIIW